MSEQHETTGIPAPGPTNAPPDERKVPAELAQAVPDGDSAPSRVVVIVIKDGKVTTVVGTIPLDIASAEAWRPNLEAIRAKYGWVCRVMGDDALVGLARDVMAL